MIVRTEKIILAERRYAVKVILFIKILFKAGITVFAQTNIGTAIEHFIRIPPVERCFKIDRIQANVS